MENIRKLKLAFLGVSHWHVPLYLEAVEKEGLFVAAVSDPDEALAGRFAARLGCKAYTDAEKLLDEVKPDFVFAFDMHCRMPALAELLIPELTAIENVAMALMINAVPRSNAMDRAARALGRAAARPLRRAAGRLRAAAARRFAARCGKKAEKKTKRERNPKKMLQKDRRVLYN